MKPNTSQKGDIVYLRNFGGLGKPQRQGFFLEDAGLNEAGIEQAKVEWSNGQVQKITYRSLMSQLEYGNQQGVNPAPVILPDALVGIIPPKGTPNAPRSKVKKAKAKPKPKPKAKSSPKVDVPLTSDATTLNDTIKDSFAKLQWALRQAGLLD